MTPETARVARLGRCGACRGRIKVETERETFECPLCSLTLLNAPGLNDLPPIVVPRAGRDACWRALGIERRLPDEPGATELRGARMLLVPYWRLMDETRRSTTRPGLVVSGVDLSPVGLPRLTAERPRIAGLDVEPRTRTGDTMGRLAGEKSGDIGLPAAGIVAVTLGPDGGPPGASLAVSADRPADAGRPWWQLVYYPVWSFHYVVYNKEHYHVVDAVTALPIGPARRMRRGGLVMATMGAMLAVFLALEPLAGAVAALPAWLASLAVMRLTLRSGRGA